MMFLSFCSFQKTMENKVQNILTLEAYLNHLYSELRNRRGIEEDMRDELETTWRTLASASVSLMKSVH